MASVWTTRADGRNERRITGGLTPDNAIVALAIFADQWRTAYPGRTLKWNSKVEVSLVQAGAITGLMWCEFLSPPSAQEPGQPKRQSA
jgi:hypothetical protein